MSSPASARTVLRRATHDHHERVDRVYSQVRLDDRTAYGRFLTAQAAAHIAVEQALEAGGIAAIVPDWAARTRRDQLVADLAELGLATPPLAGTLRLDGDAALLGALYVLEGSRLGGTLLKRSVPADFPTRFLSNADSAAWQALLRQLDQHLDSDATRAAAVDAAGRAFALFEESGRRYLSGD